MPYYGRDALAALNKLVLVVKNASVLEYYSSSQVAVIIRGKLILSKVFVKLMLRQRLFELLLLLRDSVHNPTDCSHNY